MPHAATFGSRVAHVDCIQLDAGNQVNRFPRGRGIGIWYLLVIQGTRAWEYVYIYIYIDTCCLCMLACVDPLSKYSTLIPARFSIMVRGIKV